MKVLWKDMYDYYKKPVAIGLFHIMMFLVYFSMYSIVLPFAPNLFCSVITVVISNLFVKLVWVNMEYKFEKFKTFFIKNDEKTKEEDDDELDGLITSITLEKMKSEIELLGKKRNALKNEIKELEEKLQAKKMESNISKSFSIS